MLGDNYQLFVSQMQLVQTITNVFVIYRQLTPTICYHIFTNLFPISLRTLRMGMPTIRNTPNYFSQ